MYKIINVIVNCIFIKNCPKIRHTVTVRFEKLLPKYSLDFINLRVSYYYVICKCDTFES